MNITVIKIFCTIVHSKINRTRSGCKNTIIPFNVWQQALNEYNIDTTCNVCIFILLQELFNIQFKYIHQQYKENTRINNKFTKPFSQWLFSIAECYIKPKDFIKYIGVVFTIHLLDFSPFVKIDGMMRLHSIEWIVKWINGKLIHLEMRYVINIQVWVALYD